MPNKVEIKLDQKIPMKEYVSPKFLQGMIDRMIMSYHKYHGPGQQKLSQQSPSDHKAIDMIWQRLDKYAETGNTEWLMDVANCAMIEYMYPSHYKAHFKATTDEESPGMPGGEEEMRKF